MTTFHSGFSFWEHEKFKWGKTRGVESVLKKSVLEVLCESENCYGLKPTCPAKGLVFFSNVLL
jgi:hypothetical protein